MIYVQILAGILLIAAYVHFQLTKRRNKYNLDLISEQLSSSDELKRRSQWGYICGLKGR
ncbi:hypothetical protein ACI2OX_04145 [Bacillus sp. N9]